MGFSDDPGETRVEVVAGLTQIWVDENARTAQDQDDFMNKYREYDARFQELQRPPLQFKMNGLVFYIRLLICHGCDQ